METSQSSPSEAAAPAGAVAGPSTHPREPLTAEELQGRKRLVEAALYVAGYPLELKTLCSVSGLTSKRMVHEIARTLTEEYRSRGGALEILELESERFVMQLKPECVHRVRRLTAKPLLTEGPLKTLSYVAYRQPVAQAKVILVRGPQAYEHIQRLEEMGLVSKERFGKSHLLRTTNLFSDYFSLSKEPKLMRRQLETIFTRTPQPSAGQPQGETQGSDRAGPSAPKLTGVAQDLSGSPPHLKQ